MDLNRVQCRNAGRALVAVDLDAEPNEGAVHHIQFIGYVQLPLAVGVFAQVH